jgi:hypothetical protein
MAKDVTIKVKVDTKDGQKSVGDLNKEIGNTTKVAVDVRQKLRDLQNRMAEIGDVGSAEFQQLAREAGKYKDQMNNANAAIKAMSADFPRLQVGVQALGAMGAAAGAAQASMSIFGAENEDAAKAMQKMMAITTLTNSVNQFANMLGDESAIGLKIRTILTNLKTKADKKGTTALFLQAAGQKALNIAQKAGAVGMRILNTVMKANPVMLIVAALAALVAGLAWFFSSTEKAAEANEEFNKTFEKQRGLIEDTIEAAKKRASQAIELAQAQGASEKELHELRLDQLKVEEESRKTNIKTEEDFIKGKRKLYKQALEEGNEELAKEIREEIEGSRDKYKELIKQNGDYNHKKKIEDLNYQNHLDAVNDQEVADDEKKNQEKLKNWKKYLDNKKSGSRLLEDLNQFLAGDEISANKLKYDRLIEDTLSNENLLQAHKTKLVEGYNIKRGIEEAAIISKNAKKKSDAQDKIDEADKKKQDKADDEYYKKQDEQYALLQELQNTQLQNEINAVVLNYEKKFALAEGNAALELALKIQLQKDIDAINDAALEEQKKKDEQANAEKLSAFEATAQAASAVFEEAMNGSISSIGTAFAALSDAVFGEEGLFAKLKDGSLTVMEGITIGVEMAMSAIQSVFDSQQESAAESRELRFEADTEALNQALANRSISQKQFDQRMAELEQNKKSKEMQAKKKAFKQEKGMAIVSAIMGTAQGVISGLANAFPLNIIMSALAGAMGAAQIGIIASQKFKAARGGVVPGAASMTDSVNSLLAPGEIVINSNSAGMFPELLSSINQAGGGIQLAPDKVQRATMDSKEPIYGDNMAQQPIKAYVVENEVTEKQKKINRIEKSAEFG